MAINNRVFYAIQQFSLTPNGEPVNLTTGTSTNTVVMHGIQSVGITTTFNLEQVFELGQLAIYENIEGVPDIEVTVEKVLDGYAPVFLAATRDATNDTLVGRSNARVQGHLGIVEDTQESVGQWPHTEVYMSGLFVSSVSYTIPVDGNATESVTLVGNNKRWRTMAEVAEHEPRVSGTFRDNLDTPAASVGVSRAWDVEFGYSHTAGQHLSEAGDAVGVGILNCVSGTLLPPEIDGISSSGTNDKTSDGTAYKARIQNITTSVDLGREELFQLGKKAPYHRYVNFPVEVSTEITALAISGDMIDAKEEADNLTNRRIMIHLKEGLKVNLGDKNKLASIGYSGGDAGGDNVELSYSYTTFNDFTVTHNKNGQATATDGTARL